MSINAKEFTILLATENVTFRNNLATSLRMQGYKVELANGGFHLLHVLEFTDNIDLVILHENMHDMSAYEIVSLIRVNKTKEELPVVFISRSKKVEEIDEMLSIETNEFIEQTPAFQPIIIAAKKYCSI